jgi:hypothetical protein
VAKWPASRPHPAAGREGRDVRVGDRLIPVEAQPYDLQFFPHPPKEQQIRSPDGDGGGGQADRSGGPHDVIAISGGSREGIDNGTVFSIWRAAATVDHHQGRPGLATRP